MELKDFFNKLLGRYKAPERAKKQKPKKRVMIMTSDGKDVRYRKNGKIANQRGAFGKGGRGYVS